MRIVDERGRSATSDGTVYVLEEARTWRIFPPESLRVHACRLGPISLAREGDGAFVMKVGHAVGEAELTLETDDGALRQRIDLRPREDKLDIESWCALVDELDAWLPGVVVGLSEAAQGSVGSEGTPAGLLAAALVPLAMALVRSVEAVAMAPRTLEITREDERRMHSVRRASAETLRWLGRHSSARVASLTVSETSATSDPWVVARVVDVSLDHPANRAVRWFAERVARHLRPIALALRAVSRSKFDTTALWCETQSRALEDAAAALESAVSRGFLSRLPAEPPSATALLTLADDPVYARVLRLARRILSARFSKESDREAPPAPVRESFDLYELWCLLALQRAIDAALGDGAWAPLKPRADSLFGWNLRGIRLRRALSDGVIEIGYNLEFQSHLNAPDGERVALTGERRPDLTISWRPSLGQSSWVVLDAKYRVSPKAMNESFAALHVYRDGLWWKAFGGRARAGLLLIPHVLDGCAPWAASEFRDAFGLGLWELRPGAAPDASLAHWLLDALRGASPAR